MKAEYHKELDVNKKKLNLIISKLNFFILVSKT
jgi:hypothetical protein